MRPKKTPRVDFQGDIKRYRLIYFTETFMKSVKLFLLFITVVVCNLKNF